VSRRRLLAEVHDRMSGPEQSAALLRFEAAAQVGRVRVADVQAIAGARGIAAPAGDGQFLVLVDGGPAPTAAVAARLLTSFSAPGAGTGMLPGSVSGLASVGIAEMADAGTVPGLLDRARMARERAARQATGVEWFDSELADAAARYRTLLQQLPYALQRGEFVLLYHPIVDIVAERPVGAHAIVRWRSPVLGTVEPHEFLAAADETGDITELGHWILHQTCRQLSRWQDDDPALWVQLRIVDRYLLDPKMVGNIETALRTHGVIPEQFVVQVAETAVVYDPMVAVDQLATLRALGVRTCLSGGGTAGLAFAQLRRLPMDLLRLTSAGENAGLSEARLAAQVTKRFGVELLAEGVTSTADLARLRLAGCRLATGPVFGEARAAEHFEAYVRNFRYPAVPVAAGDPAGRITLGG
jgi:predicted signal transduction protein with EAL and GGDEF domain